MPHHAKEWKILENLLSSSGAGLRYTKSVVLRTLPKSLGFREKNNSDRPTSTTELSLPEDAWTKTVNALIRVLLRKIPKNTLETFTWIHNCVVKKATLESISSHHGASLRRLDLGPYIWDGATSMDDVLSLQALCLPSILPIRSVELLLTIVLVFHNRSSLSSLDLGVEFRVVKSLMSDAIYEDSNPSNRIAKRIKYEISKNFQDDERPVCLPNLTHLRLRGLDFGTLMYGYGQQLIDFRVLTHLTLESCCGLINALPKLGATPLPSLQSFHIRQEIIDRGFLNMLESFLCALPPLTALFVLLDSVIDTLDLISVMEIHGKSLQALVMDLRDGDRIPVLEDVSAWRRQYSIAIIEHCPNLIELGIPIDWAELALRSTHCRMFMNYIKTCLPKLQILNIRNLPEIPESVTAIPTDTMVKGLALEWMESLIWANLVERESLQFLGGLGDPPSIVIIAFGSLMYRDLWDGAHVYDNSIKNDLQTLQTFLVDYRRTSHGEWAPLLTHLSTGSTKFNQHPYRDISILEPYWLI
ncbi:hypothetical protein G7Y79_00016g041080 [Physcia stellaris]|nr:hypothetical protein G7Y79_00016g041080 [Physcia stellaris]